MDSENVLICGVPESRSLQRKIRLVAFSPAPGSVKVRANCCGIKVWIGPKQQAALESAPGTPVVCVLCTAGHANMVKGIFHLGGQGGQYTLDSGEQFPPQKN